MAKSTHTGRVPGAIVLATRFKQYEKSIRDAWEAYWLVNHYLPKVKDLLKAGKLDSLDLPALGRPNHSKQLSRDDTYGAITHTLAAVVPERTLLAAVTETEAFLQDMVRRVLTDFPGKLRVSSASANDTEGSSKLVEMILRSRDRSEIIDRIVEERVRGLFYGAPADFFTKKTSKMELDDTFSVEFKSALQRYTEICARRNCIVHNKARSDRKYYREIGKDDDSDLGRKLPISAQYLRDSLNTLRGMAAIACQIVCTRIYKSPPPPGAVVHKCARSFRSRESASITAS